MLHNVAHKNISAPSSRSAIQLLFQSIAFWFLCVDKEVSVDCGCHVFPQLRHSLSTTTQHNLLTMQPRVSKLALTSHSSNHTCSDLITSLALSLWSEISVSVLLAATDSAYWMWPNNKIGTFMWNMLLLMEIFVLLGSYIKKKSWKKNWLFRLRKSPTVALMKTWINEDLRSIMLGIKSSTFYREHSDSQNWMTSIWHPKPNITQRVLITYSNHVFYPIC